LARIAVIDDHAFFRMGVEAALRDGGHEIVLSVGDGRDACEAVKRADPDVVLLDQRMSPVDGATVLRSLREHGQNLPVILLTNELSDAALLKVMQSRVDGIVFKHCPEERLFEALKAVLAGRRFIDGDLIDKSLALSSGQTEEVSLDQLSQREKQITMLVCQGLKNREIGTKLEMSEGTVKLYLHNIYRKLGVANRTSLALKITAVEA
jgi:two-component system nitrate/nitrite response regulator NarL